jgi:hypothetical protein
MASIAISDLRPAGAELFMDSESFLSELSDGELSGTFGASPPVVVASAVACFKISLAVTAGAAAAGALVGAAIAYFKK